MKNKKLKTYENVFKTLKTIYNFNPIILTSDFSRAITNAIRNIYPKCIKIKCLFHFLQSLIKKIKNLGLNTKENHCIIKEIIFNIKILTVLEHKKIKKFYNKLKNNFQKKITLINFFLILKSNGSLLVKQRKLISYQYGIIIQLSII